MTDKELLELYSDYLISAFGQTTATGLSALLDGQVSHDQVQRFLASPKRTSADLWQIVKPHVRSVQHDDGVLILDDNIAEKPSTDENDIICWHARPYPEPFGQGHQLPERTVPRVRRFTPS